MIHGIEQISGKVKIFKDKSFKMVSPLKKLKVSYPNHGTYNVKYFWPIIMFSISSRYYTHSILLMEGKIDNID